MLCVHACSHLLLCGFSLILLAGHIVRMLAFVRLMRKLNLWGDAIDHRYRLFLFCLPPVSRDVGSTPSSQNTVYISSFSFGDASNMPAINVDRKMIVSQNNKCPSNTKAGDEWSHNNMTHYQTNWTLSTCAKSNSRQDLETRFETRTIVGDVRKAGTWLCRMRSRRCILGTRRRSQITTRWRHGE
jgi:hypothetical protein